MTNKPLNAEQEKANLFVAKIRSAVADYMRSDGCSCCRDIEAHERHEEVLAKMLDVPKYKDGSGHNFAKFKSKP